MTAGKGMWGLVGALVLLLLSVSWAWSQSNSRFQAAAVVGEKTISEAEWIAVLKQKFGRQVLQDMINREVVFQEAEKLGIVMEPKQMEKELAKIRESYGVETDEELEAELVRQVGTNLEALKQELSYQYLLRELATREITVSEEQMLEVFHNNPERFYQPLRVHLWQIVVASRAEAEQVRSELQAGANFETLAKERSIDSVTSASGGDMGWVMPEKSPLPDEAAAVIAELEEGEISHPVPIPDGYAIFRVTDIREPKQLTFAEAKEDLRREMALAQVESLDDVLERLRESAGVEILVGEMAH
mgnify:CR=1 FL=1